MFEGGAGLYFAPVVSTSVEYALGQGCIRSISESCASPTLKMRSIASAALLLQLSALCYAVRSGVPGPVVETTYGKVGASQQAAVLSTSISHVLLICGIHPLRMTWFVCPRR